MTMKLIQNKTLFGGLLIYLGKMVYERQYIISITQTIWDMPLKSLDLPSSGALLSTKAYAQNLLTGPL